MGSIRLVLVLLFAVVASGCTLVLSPRAYFEHRSCLTLRPGMSEEEALKIMGRPQEQTDRPTGERVLYYRWRHGDSGPMQVILVKKGGEYVVDYPACEGLG